MELKKLSTLALSGVLFASVMGLTSCNSSSVGVKKGDTIFHKNAYVEVENIPERIHLKVELPGAVEYINVGTRVRINKDQVKYSKGILSIDGKAFLNEKGVSKLNSGEKRLSIKCKDVTSMQNVPLLFVDKVIKTADELQQINNNPSGSYILGNDIDCSSITNFEPLGYVTTPTSDRINQEFLGVFDGNGYAIKNLTSRYSLNMASEKEMVKNQNYLFDDESHKAGNQFGVFQIIGASGIVRNTAFINCKVYGRTMAGVIAGQNSGLIENCFVDANSSASISTHFYDEACNVGGLVGLNDADDTDQCIRNCISLASCYISDQFIGYGDEYVEENTRLWLEANPDGDISTVPQDQLKSWTFYGSTKGSDKIDSNGKETNGVYAGVGMSFGSVYNCYAKKFTISNSEFSMEASFGQTHLFNNKNGDGPDSGNLVNCAVKTEEELKSAALYESFPTDSWNIFDGSIPSLKAYYAFEIAK